MLKTTNQKVALGLFLLSIVYLILSFNLPPYPYVPIDSDIVPIGLGFILAGLSVALYFIRDPKVTADDKEKNSIPRQEKLMLLAVLVMIILYILLLQPLGFIISTALFIFFCSRILGYKKHIVNLIVSILFPIGVYFAFTIGLQVSLPQGILPF